MEDGKSQSLIDTLRRKVRGSVTGKLNQRNG